MIGLAAAAVVAVLSLAVKSIAAQAGVTQATVSMSLANNPRIPAITRERIQAIARKLNYQPNPYVSTLMRIRRQGKPLKDKGSWLWLEEKKIITVRGTDGCG